jgi:hypothetical protein
MDCGGDNETSREYKGSGEDRHRGVLPFANFNKNIERERAPDQRKSAQQQSHADNGVNRSTQEIEEGQAAHGHQCAID